MSEAPPAARKRPSLFGAVAPEKTAKNDSAPPEQPTERAARSAIRGRQDRQDKRQIAGFFSPACAKQLRMLAAEEDTTVQDLLKEALNLMFQAHSKPPIA